MKQFNKYILEAVNRGIKLALDNFDDEVPVAQSISKVKSKDLTSEYLDLLDQFVDLGLPSGTLWCKYNLGCDLDKLNNDPKNITEEDWYGNYYAWGETEEKEIYDWVTYKWCIDDRQNQLTKYCKSGYGYQNYQDNLRQLQSIDDVVTQTFGPGFHMPTENQMNELLDNTNYEMVEDFEVNGKKVYGLNGLLYKSKVNNNYVFFPMAGWKSYIGDTYHNDRESGHLKWHDKGTYCQMWLADQPIHSASPYANCLGANIKLKNGEYTGVAVYQTLRCWGLPIRPVLNR